MSNSTTDYSSILLFVGTNTGRFSTFKVLPEAHGGYTVQPAGTANLEDQVISISPLIADSGKPAYASQQAYSSLRQDFRFNGVVLVVTITGVRLFKPAASKGASKSWSEFFCDAASVVRSIDGAVALVGLFGDGNTRTFSIPGLKEISCTKIESADPRRFPEAIISSSGAIFGWTGPSEIAVLNPWGSGQDM